MKVSFNLHSSKANRNNDFLLFQESVRKVLNTIYEKEGSGRQCPKLNKIYKTEMLLRKVSEVLTILTDIDDILR